MQKADRAEFAPFDASAWCIGMVVAQFNHNITQRLQRSALARAADYDLSPDHITILPVAGAIEIPLALQHLAASSKYQALLAIGCIIRGDTPHFDYVAKFVTEGILHVQLEHSLPIGFGVLTCEDESQAIARAELGSEHLDAVLQLAKQLQATPRP